MEKNEQHTTNKESPFWVLGAVYRNENIEEKTDKDSEYMQLDEHGDPVYGLGV